MKLTELINRLSMSWVLLTSLSTFAFGGGVRKAPLAPPEPSSNADAFIPFDLGVGRDQHYSLANRRYFTNIVAVAVGDLDGDNNQDIVMLANAIPQNGAYSAAGPTQNHNYSHYCFGSSVFKLGGSNWHGEFVEPGDMLYDAASTLSGLNPVDSTPGWFTPTAMGSLNGTSRTQTVHYAPPSPNVVAGMITNPPYIGSDLAWLQGDGRGNFTLRFITPRERGVLGPARIRMGTEIRLAKMSPSAVPGLDIVLISANDNRTNVYQPQASTSIELFTGTSRVTWLENNGWVGNRLDFTDHGIAEYTYDRNPNWIFYAAHQNTSGGWVGPYASLQPINVEILPIDSGPELDVLVANIPESSHAAMNVRYDGTNPSIATLNAYYSAAIPRPQVGDLWVQNDQLWPTGGITGSVSTILWYENSTIGGSAHLSTATFHTAFLNVVGSTFSATFRQLVPMRVRGGQAFVTIQEAGAGSQVYLRQPIADELVLSLAPTRIPPVSNFRNGAATAADMDGDNFDELLVRTFDCIGGCYDKVKVYSVNPNVNRTDVSVNMLFEHKMEYKHGAFNGWAISDMNGDGRNDVFIPSTGENGNLMEGVAALILVNTTPPGGPVSFFPITQKNPVLPPKQRNTSGYSQIGYGSSGAVNNSMRVATGDFNRDGSNDVVRVGPILPATVFLSNFDGLQRSRVTATVEHRTGATKTWTSVWGGETAGPNIRPYTGDPATASGGIGIQAVQTE